ncbi:MAG: DUF3500 domain-containing protein [Planctomycetota bacterium]|nr:DUF3500 domain-containing protein [Planctomycetota bacterium]
MCSGVCGLAVIWLASVLDDVPEISKVVMTPVAAEMRQHALSFLQALSDSQRLSAQKSLDDKSRMDWTFFPRVRNGLELADLRDNVAAFASAKALLNCGLSDSGAKIAANIRRLDPREDRGGGVRLGPDRYAITIFGQPSSDARWGWRVEGHHLTLNWTIDGGRVVSVTPMAFGISPFVDQAGEPQALGGDQQAYLDFLGTLDANTRATAKRDGPMPGEVPGVGKPRPTSGDRVGVRFSGLSEATQAAAWKVLDTVYDRLDPELAWMRRASARAQAEDIFFSWSGTGLAFRPNAYRIEGRDFTFDFVNAQDEGNHVHTLYREGGRDFGQEVPSWTRVASGQFFTEGPVWSPPSTLLFSDMRFDGSAGHIVSLNESGKLQRLWSSPKVANGLMFDGAGRLWACLFGHGTLASFAWQDGAVVDERTEISGYQGQRFLKTNDLVFDASGGLWFTDPLFGRKAGEQPVMGVYYRRPTGAISLVIEDLNRPNGIMLSPNEETLYVLPSSGSSGFAYDITAPGVVANRRAFGQVPGGGDGMTVDAQGNVYLTSGRLRSVVVVNPAGVEIDRIGLPGGPSNVCFGGPANRTLFVTAGDSVYAVPRKQPGWIFPGSRPEG